MAMEDYIGRTYSGYFWSTDLKKTLGEMHLERRKPSLYLWSDERFNLKPTGYIHCQLHDLQKVSFLYPRIESHVGSKGITKTKEIRYFARLRPQIALFGETYLSNDDKSIKAITFVIHDSTTLFYDFDAFSMSPEPEQHIDGLVNSMIDTVERSSEGYKFDREIPTGPHPIIGFFTGKTSLLSEETQIGHINIFHNPSYSFIGGADGFSVRNRVACEINFKEHTIFDDAYDAMQKVIQFFELLVGREQEITELTLELESPDDEPCFLDAFLCYQKAQSDTTLSRNEPQPGDNLLDCVRKPEEFAQSLNHWLNTYDNCADSRQQFNESFVMESYNSDRLVKAANMFDILPDSVYEPLPVLNADVARKRDECKAIFKSLPKDSIERQKILVVLRNLDKLDLKKKIRLLTEKVTAKSPDRFKSLSFVTDQAVDCRNFFVHGGKRKFDYHHNFYLLVFLIDTLEFVYAASLLIEAEWDIDNWVNTPSSQSHPFARFKISYRGNLRDLKEAVSTKEK